MRKYIRMPEWLKNLEYHFSNYKWYRKWYGGCWELWWVDVVHSKIWHNGNLNYWFGRPSPLCRGELIKREDYSSILYHHLF